MSSVSEPFGLTALEAAANNNAIILTKTSGVAEQVHNVLLYDFWDTNKLADDLVNLALSPALQSTLKESIAQEYDNYSWGDAAEKFMRTYANVTLRGASRGAVYA
jgi:glycosyltransferase involved in cell wall biosynthesis